MTWVGRTFRASYKFVLFIFYVTAYLSISYLGRLYFRSERKRREFHARTVTFVVSRGCKMLNIRRRYINVPSAEKSFLLVGNHLGFLDILVLASLRPTLFVTSMEMRETPLLGLLCEMGGCLFVERRNRLRILTEMEEIRSALKDGFSVALYPEGTSGDGSRVLPFKKSLLMAAAETGVPIKAMVINYRKINGEPMDHRWRDYVCWYGDLAFLPAIWRLFQLKSIDVDLSFHDEIHLTPDHDRRKVAALVQGIIEMHYDPIPFPEGEAIKPAGKIKESN
ncbi:MAG: 1-acyl-sn-glycerol-3-phosphate acyltransferase [Bdellovibrio sp.]|nr:MAG: 1-acyl-sn-glycerol-3-phosphate acyltransferase [Bdellovibrio sp.]